MKFQDAVVLVTGSNRGLGLALVRACLAAGARHIYASARDPESLGSLVRESAGRVTALALDITDPESLARAAADAPDISVLINNAGVLASFNRNSWNCVWPACRDEQPVRAPTREPIGVDSHAFCQMLANIFTCQGSPMSRPKRRDGDRLR